MTFLITQKDVKEAEVYFTTRKILENPSVESPKISKILLNKLQAEVNVVINEVFRRCDINNHQELFIFFNLEMPYKMGVKKFKQTKDNTIKIYPTRIVKEKNKRISPIAIKVKSSCYNSGKYKANNTFSIFCALMTLANGQLYNKAILSRSKNKKLEFTKNIDEIDEERLYPQRTNFPTLEKLDNMIWDRTDSIWLAYCNLTKEEKKYYKLALFAYNTACETSKNQQTLSIIPYISALGSLANSYQKRCSGDICCSNCGSLNFKHNIVGDKAAISLLIIEILQIKEDKQNDLKKMINRIYDKQRSAYVHNAKLRHTEYNKGFGTPSAFPTKTKLVKDLFVYQNDLSSLKHLTRQVLLKWLSKKSKINFDDDLFGHSRFESSSLIQSVVTIPSNITLCVHNK